jgi:hypothetical protein
VQRLWNEVETKHKELEQVHVERMRAKRVRRSGLNRSQTRSAQAVKNLLVHNVRKKLPIMRYKRLPRTWRRLKRSSRMSAAS